MVWWHWAVYGLLILVGAIGLSIGLYFFEEWLAKRQEKRRAEFGNELGALQQIECLIVLQHPSEWTLAFRETGPSLFLSNSHPCVLFQLYEGSLKYETCYDGLAGLFSSSCLLSDQQSCPVEDDEQIWSRMSSQTQFVVEFLRLVLNPDDTPASSSVLLVDAHARIQYNQLISKIVVRFSNEERVIRQLRQFARDECFLLRLRVAN